MIYIIYINYIIYIIYNTIYINKYNNIRISYMQYWASIPILFPSIHSLPNPDPLFLTQSQSGSPINDRDPAHYCISYTVYMSHILYYYILYDSYNISHIVTI